MGVEILHVSCRNTNEYYFMKQIVVVRHAKSSWADPGQNDFDRPLNERGKKDAPAMGQCIVKAGVKIDAFVSSPAKRAHQTCKAFAEVYGRKEEEIVFVKNLYHAPAHVYYETLGDLDDAYKSVAIFGHNPGITDFVNTLCKGVHTDNMPTCAVFALKADVKSWKDFENAEKEFIFFKTPKD